MKKVLIFSLLSVMATGVWALPSPVSQNGTALPIEYIGCQMASIDNSTGTNLVVLNSTGTGGVSIGPAIVYGIIASSISQNDYLVLKDTAGRGSNGQIASQVLLQSVSSTVVIGNWFQNLGSTSSMIWPYPTLNLIKFPVPLQFINGILAVASAAPTSNNGVSRWTILYRTLGKADK